MAHFSHHEAIFILSLVFCALWQCGIAIYFHLFVKEDEDENGSDRGNLEDVEMATRSFPSGPPGPTNDLEGGGTHSAASDAHPPPSSGGVKPAAEIDDDFLGESGGNTPVNGKPGAEAVGTPLSKRLSALLDEESNQLPTYEACLPPPSLIIRRAMALTVDAEGNTKTISPELSPRDPGQQSLTNTPKRVARRLFPLLKLALSSPNQLTFGGFETDGGGDSTDDDAKSPPRVEVPLERSPKRRPRKDNASGLGDVSPAGSRNASASSSRTLIVRRGSPRKGQDSAAGSPRSPSAVHLRARSKSKLTELAPDVEEEDGDAGQPTAFNFPAQGMPSE